MVAEARHVVVLLVAAASVAAQEPDTGGPGPYARALRTWIGLAAAPGYERPAIDRIVAELPGWKRDSTGNLIVRVGDGSPRRVVACGLDAVGYAVSDITDDGYLRIHVTGSGRHVQLWDQYHEGQRVFVAAVDRQNFSRTHNVPGVVAVRSNHLWRRRAADTIPTSIENMWIDIGARSRAEVDRMGVHVLDPIFRDWPGWTYADYVAGPGAANRAGCEAVAAAATVGAPARGGETIYIISTQSGFGWTGLTAALSRIGAVDTLILASADLARAAGQVTITSVQTAPWQPLPTVDVKTIIAIAAPSRFTGTLAESVREKDLEALHRAIAAASGLTGVTPEPVRLGEPWVAPPPAVVQDSFSRHANLLARLTDIYSVSGHEAPMREAVMQALPPWARGLATVDSLGNVIVAMGPERDTTVIVAHLDEIGFEVARIARDGIVTLKTRGNFFPFLWEGQPALLHRDDDVIPQRSGPVGCGAARGGPLRGVFVPRDSAGQKEPPALTAWFGLDSSGLAAAGIVAGSPITSYKCSARLGEIRFTARSIDDRAGTAALILALGEVTASQLDHKVIFAWSVREEGGLEGAKALAASLGPSVHRVHAVDTFVSSDSPLESRRFAFAPIGQGAVVRALDNSSVAPPDEIERVVRLARAAQIPLQVGVTNGGNDGSELARVGAINIAFAWPLRYSHSPAEVMDLRDLRSLARLVAAVAKAPAVTKTPKP